MREGKDQKLVNIKFDISILNKIIGYVFKKTRYISNSNLRNVQKLFNICNLEQYKSRPIILERIDFILKVLKARLDCKYEDEAIILNYATPDGENSVVEEILKNLEHYSTLNYSEMDFITHYIEDRLKHGALISKIPEMKDIIEMVESEEYDSYGEVHEKVKSWMQEYSSIARQVSTSWTRGRLNFNDPNIEEKVTEMVERLGDKSSVLITGIRMLNEMLSPGFRPAKLYIFLGISGGFKSAMLLKIILDCARYNATRYRPKREGTKPCVLYITMENTIDESFARVWNMLVENTDVETHKPSEIVKRLKKERLIANENIDVIFQYYPNMSITTQEIRDLIDELEVEGREVILVSFDYIGRIRSQVRTRDEKETLGNVTNELRQIAIDYQIPVVSAQQFNRPAIATINEGMRNGKADLIRFLGAEHIGSAIEIQQNADMTIGLNLERKQDNQLLYLSFLRMKERYRPSTRLNYFNQPFQRENEIMLQDDILLERPLGIISLATDMEGIDVNKLYNQRGRTSHKQPTMDKGKVTEDTFDLESI